MSTSFFNVLPMYLLCRVMLYQWVFVIDIIEFDLTQNCVVFFFPLLLPLADDEYIYFARTKSSKENYLVVKTQAIFFALYTL